MDIVHCSFGFSLKQMRKFQIYWLILSFARSSPANIYGQLLIFWNFRSKPNWYLWWSRHFDPYRFASENYARLFFLAGIFATVPDWLSNQRILFRNFKHLVQMVAGDKMPWYVKKWDIEHRLSFLGMATNWSNRKSCGGLIFAGKTTIPWCWKVTVCMATPLPFTPIS
jgi:hypothetical protein